MPVDSADCTLSSRAALVRRDRGEVDLEARRGERRALDGDRAGDVARSTDRRRRADPRQVLPDAEAGGRRRWPTRSRSRPRWCRPSRCRRSPRRSWPSSRFPAAVEVVERRSRPPSGGRPPPVRRPGGTTDAGAGKQHEHERDADEDLDRGAHPRTICRLPA